MHAEPAAIHLQTKAGWLMKRSSVCESSHWVKRSAETLFGWCWWDLRYVVLTGNELVYYRERFGTYTERGRVSLSGSCTVAVSQVSKNSLEVRPATGKTLFIAASSEAERNSWIAAIARRSTETDDETTDDESLDQPEALLPDATGTTLAEFQLMHVIASGGFGEVVKARRRGRDYAIKMLSKRNIVARQRQGAKDLQHTLSERQVLALVTERSHPFLLGLRFAFQSRSRLFFVTDLCAGGDLADLLYCIKRTAPDGRGVLREPQARFYAAQIFLALQHLHALRIVYRDLKPANVLRDAAGHLKLADFGLTKALPDGGEEGTHTLCGTPYYLAPEVWAQQAHGLPVDWWSFGCVLYEMVCGEPPFLGEHVGEVRARVLAHARSPPAAASTVACAPRALSPACAALLDGLLRGDPTERLGKHARAADIQQHAFFAPLAAPPPPPPAGAGAPTTTTARRWRSGWEALLARALPPPYKGRRQLRPEAAIGPAHVHSPPSSLHLSDEEQAAFDGFDFVAEEHERSARALEAPAAWPAASSVADGQTTQPDRVASSSSPTAAADNATELLPLRRHVGHGNETTPC